MTDEELLKALESFMLVAGYYRKYSGRPWIPEMLRTDLPATEKVQRLLMESGVFDLLYSPGESWMAVTYEKRRELAVDKLK